MQWVTQSLSNIVFPTPGFPIIKTLVTLQSYTYRYWDPIINGEIMVKLNLAISIPHLRLINTNKQNNKQKQTNKKNNRIYTVKSTMGNKL